MSRLLAGFAQGPVETEGEIQAVPYGTRQPSRRCHLNLTGVDRT
jgi:hypothetical protein